MAILRRSTQSHSGWLKLNLSLAVIIRKNRPFVEAPPLTLALFLQPNTLQLTEYHLHRLAWTWRKNANYYYCLTLNGKSAIWNAQCWNRHRREMRAVDARNSLHRRLIDERIVFGAINQEAPAFPVMRAFNSMCVREWGRLCGCDERIITWLYATPALCVYAHLRNCLRTNEHG